MVTPLESKFKNIVVTRLKETDRMYFFVKEAKALRGIADIIGCYRGLFFAWELKRSEKEGNKKSGRIVLQKHYLNKVKEAGGVGEIIYPENFNEMYHILLATGNSLEF